ncbi:hypothetical protein [Poritiphilus flavus]|uniref:Uncharacterized protein n=1 Tax=Poritiphilus flavus TaxID=2697053 RepID=A0A6L9EDY0_9FLAO|nr:hypothetical protein [Poritiphilus flavus]NAS12964.1 hypothetical protein [Poritiphilus flavus]
MLLKPHLWMFFMGIGFCASQEIVSSRGDLPSAVQETSGLIFHNGKLVTHNDSGDEAVLYEIDTTDLAISRMVTLDNANHTDWEDITADESYIYVGDIGNNLGDRTELTVYRIAKEDYDVSDNVTAEAIKFSYEDEPDFMEGEEPAWDAEALVAYKEELLIFTKQPQDGNTGVYSIPKVPGNHTARRIAGYNANGLITGATFNASESELYLVGYSIQLVPFLVRIPDLNGDFNFTTGTERLQLTLNFGQVEAITHSSGNQYYLSSERFSSEQPPINSSAQLFYYTPAADPGEEPEEETPEEDEESVAEDPDNVQESTSFILYREPGSNVLKYTVPPDNTVFGRALFDTTGRRVRFTHGIDIRTNAIDLTGLRGGVYYLSLYLSGETVSKPFAFN